MEALIRNGYQAGRRPSGHDISAKFAKRGNGAIPSSLLGFAGEESRLTAMHLDGAPFEAWFPNLLAIANTNSQDRYLRALRERHLKPHPARFPIGLPAFFIEFLTEPGDVVCDPFAGSNTTGEAAERLGRDWISCELDREGKRTGTYVHASALRFDPELVEYPGGLRDLANGSYKPRQTMVAGTETPVATCLDLPLLDATNLGVGVSNGHRSVPAR